MTKQSYPRISQLQKNPIQKRVNPKDTGKPMTIPNQAMTLKDIVQRSISGFPVPMAREELVLHPDLNQVLEGTTMDIISDAKYSKMSKVERQTYLNNIKGLKQQLSEKVQEQITQKQKIEASMLLEKQQPITLTQQNITPTIPK